VLARPDTDGIGTVHRVPLDWVPALFLFVFSYVSLDLRILVSAQASQKLAGLVVRMGFFRHLNIQEHCRHSQKRYRPLSRTTLEVIPLAFFSRYLRFSAALFFSR